MDRPYAYFPMVDEFYITSDYADPDRVTVSLVARDEQDKKGVLKFTLSDDINYPSATGLGSGLTLPLAEDFLQQFAAIMGYRVVKD